MPWVSSKQAVMMFQEAETTYSKAAKSELQHDLDRAFRLYIKAAEDFLHLSQTSNDAKLRASCKTQAGKALERAEKIKAVRPDLTPVVKDYFSEQEQMYVLRKSSFVNNVRIPLWDEESYSSTDARQPPLSPDQQLNSATWRKAEGTQVYSATIPLLPQDVIQHIITDCSVCASVAVCVCHHSRFHSKIALSNLRPHDPNDTPYHSTTGIYHFRFHFNGAYRRITIDDQLPTYPDGTLMCMSSGSKRLMWPSLAEKAYMKLMGDMTFLDRGRCLNSCIDLYALTGWIPEHIDLKSPQRERLWKRVVEGFIQGHCLLTMGTGDKVVTSQWASLVSLLPTHCYAVIDVRDDGDRQLTMLDSWILPTAEEHMASTSEGQPASPEEPTKSHTFDLSWDMVCNVFDGIYLSWDPGIFLNHIVFHGTWKTPSSTLQDGMNHSSHFRLQLHTGTDKMQGQQEIWIQLTRHVSDTKRTSEYISLLVDSEADSEQSPADINPMTLKGEYTNSIHTLVRKQVTSADSVLQLIAAYEGHFTDVGFSINVYSNSDVSWVENLPKALHVKEVDGAFTTKTSGGNHSYPSFMNNPQYHLRVYADKDRSGTVGGSVNVKSGPKGANHRVEPQWTGGDFRSVLLWICSDNPRLASVAGDYTLIVSAFEPQQLGRFVLRIESPLRLDITPISQEGAGMFSRVLRDAWTSETAGGGPSSNKYAKNPVYAIRVDSPTQLKIRLQLLATPPASINVSLFQQKASRGSLVATSGPYSDAVAGVVTPQVVLQPGTYHAIPSTYTPGVQREFKLTIYSTAAVRVLSANRR